MTPQVPDMKEARSDPPPDAAESPRWEAGARTGQGPGGCAQDLPG
jgi:hypothetical protein